ncbi:hypothetical protein ACOMHN_025309 [Nucella lapillus]
MTSPPFKDPTREPCCTEPSIPTDDRCDGRDGAARQGRLPSINSATTACLLFIPPAVGKGRNSSQENCTPPGAGADGKIGEVIGRRRQEG